VNGRPIRALRFHAPSIYAVSRPPAVLFGAIHGDEPLGVHCLLELARELEQMASSREVWIVPALNVDGLLAGKKNNAHDVDLNRNFDAENWDTVSKPGYSGGPTPTSEPETQALVHLIDEVGAGRFVALHSPYRMVNWDGSGEALARRMAALNGYKVTDNMGYPTPGSFGSLYGVDRGLEVITLEIPPMTADEAWRENRAALRLAVELPG
jgi:protein MpaA